MLSSGTTFGTIQLPDGQLIILMADHQTTGGYPRIATIISVDLPLLAQVGPGETISFELSKQIDAEQAALKFERDIAYFKTGVRVHSDSLLNSFCDMPTIDLNCDMGESFGTWKMGNDAALMDHVTSVNIACGFHAGDPTTIRKTIEIAIEKGMAIGAHPGYPDLQGFGRRSMSLSSEDVYDIVLYQLAS